MIYNTFCTSVHIDMSSKAARTVEALVAQKAAVAARLVPLAFELAIATRFVLARTSFNAKRRLGASFEYVSIDFVCPIPWTK